MDIDCSDVFILVVHNKCGDHITVRVCFGFVQEVSWCRLCQWNKYSSLYLSLPCFWPYEPLFDLKRGRSYCLRLAAVTVKTWRVIALVRVVLKKTKPEWKFSSETRWLHRRLPVNITNNSTRGSPTDSLRSRRLGGVWTPCTSRAIQHPHALYYTSTCYAGYPTLNRTITLLIL